MQAAGTVTALLAFQLHQNPAWQVARDAPLD
jgi:hypothetical protein